MTNFHYGITADGSKQTTPTNYKAVIDPSNATPLQVTGGLSATSGAITTVNATTGNITNATITKTITGTIAIGTGGDTINVLKTYTSSAINIAAVNVAATSWQVLALTVTGVAATDQILGIRAVNAVANQFVSGATITAANTVQVAIYTAVNTNAATGQTFSVTVKR